MTEILPALSHLSGKAAVFVRGFMQHLADAPGYEAPLRKAQDSGVREVEALGETISIPYVSKLTKLLETSGVVEKVRKGRNYRVSGHKDNGVFLQMLQVLETEWGTIIQDEASEESILMRSAMLDHMTDVGSVRIEAEAPLNKVAYQVLIDKFKQGKYDMVFVDRDVVLRMEDDGEIGYHVETIHASVVNG